MLIFYFFFQKIEGLHVCFGCVPETTGVLPSPLKWDTSPNTSKKLNTGLTGSSVMANQAKDRPKSRYTLRRTTI